MLIDQVATQAICGSYDTCRTSWIACCKVIINLLP